MMFPLKYDGALAQKFGHHRHLGKMGSDVPGGQTEDRNGILWSPTDEDQWRNDDMACLAPNLGDPGTEGVLLLWLSKTGPCVIQADLSDPDQPAYTVECHPITVVWTFRANVLGEALATALMACWDAGHLTPIPARRW